MELFLAPDVCANHTARGLQLHPPSQTTCGQADSTITGAMLPQEQETVRLAAPPPLDVHSQALFLDLDGTLVDFAARPEHVVAHPALRRLLTDLSRQMSGAVALVTGRTIASADAVLGGVLVNVAGIHGLERRSAASVVERAYNKCAPVDAALAEAHALAATLPIDIEDKGAALALHYRRAPEFAETARRLAVEIAQRHGLGMLEGNMVIELKLGQRTKGHAVADFMASPPFNTRKPVALGDDVTDEDAFRAVNQRGGYAILVGAERATAARFRLASPEAVFTWLNAGLGR